jgi:hypothetical protein
MQITIELTEEESSFFCQSCFLRVTNHAADLLEVIGRPGGDEVDPDEPWVAQDLRAIGNVVEGVRHKIVSAIFLEQARKS